MANGGKTRMRTDSLFKTGAFATLGVLSGTVFAVAPAAAGPSCTTGTGLEICVTYDSSIASLANYSTVESSFNTVAQQYANALTNQAMIDIYVSSGMIAPSGSTVGAKSLAAGDVAGSFNVTDAMGATAAASFANTTAALAAAGVKNLPTTDPTGGKTFYMAQAEVKALRLASTYSVSKPYDGYIGFSNTMPFYYDTTTVSGSYSFQAAAQHEIGEVLGRTSTLNDSAAAAIYLSQANPLDLFRYSATGTPAAFTETASAYLSTDGGTTALGTVDSTSTGGDRSDWSTPAGSTTTDSQNTILAPGTNLGLSVSDGMVLQGLGYGISAGNGAGLFVATNNPAGAASSLTSIPTPEPASLSILAAGAAFTGLMRRRRPAAA
jgi:hypothetical protein